MKLFDNKILDYDYGDDEEDMHNQSPEFQQQQHQHTTIEGLDRFVFFLRIILSIFMLNYKHTYNIAIKVTKYYHVLYIYNFMNIQVLSYSKIYFYKKIRFFLNKIF